MSDEESSAPEPLEMVPPAVRQRLQQCYEFALQRVKANEFDAATELLQQCVVGDSGNKVYVQAYLDNLKKKYNNNKKGSKLASIKNMGPKGAVKKSLNAEDWPGVFKAGFEALKLNPWDFTVLAAMAEAADMSYFDDCELIYLKTAQEGDPREPAVNRLCAFALHRRGAYDQAIKCWHQVELVKKDDPEAKKAISELQSEKVFRRHGAVGGAQAGKMPVRASGRKRPPPPAWYTAKASAAKATEEAPAIQKVELTPDQVLRQAISLNPEEISNYVKLAEIFAGNHEYDKAEEILNKAVAVSNSDALALEPLEDLKMRRAKHFLSRAENKARKEATEENLQRAKRAKAELYKVEADAYRDRSERQPRDMNVKFEYATRLKRIGNFQEAAQRFQEALADPDVKGAAHLELGECYRHLKQYRAALENYEAAIESLAFRDEQLEQRKLALYLAGVVAGGLKDYETAEKHLKDVVELDSTYKDAADRLDKITQVRNKG
jgi:tetratricopeptide (TPR) repeat protein